MARLAEALARDGRFAAEDKILGVAIALERIHELGGGKKSHKMRTRSSRFLRRDPEDRGRVMKSIGDFYRVRSEFVHKGKRKPENRHCAVPGPQAQSGGWGRRREWSTSTIFLATSGNAPSRRNESSSAGERIPAPLSISPS